MELRTTTLKAAAVLALSAVLGVFALAGCSSSQGSSSAASGSSANSASGSGGTNVSLISSDSATSGSSAAASATGSASGVSVTATGSSASAAAAATVASGKLVDFVNEEAGYTFKVDGAYITETDGQNVTVYTGGKQGTVPYFKLTLMQNRSGRSVEDLLVGTADSTVERLGDRIVVEPTFAVVKHSNREIMGFEYAYTTEDGSKTILAMTYAEDVDGFFYTWTANYYKDDFETAAAVSQAVDTLQLLTA